MKQPRPIHPHQVLVVDHQDWLSRSLDSALASSGYLVERAATAREALAQARAENPDLVVVSASLHHGEGLTLCRALRSDPQLRGVTPVVLVSSEHVSREQRLAGLRAGAWEVFGRPIDADELLLRISCFVRAKLAVDDTRAECLVDSLTGLYNARGLARRGLELVSQAHRDSRPMASVAIAVVVSGADQDTTERAGRDLGRALTRTGRASDAVGRVGDAEFWILAPGSDATGAVQIAERVAAAARGRRGPHPGALEIRAGYDAVPDMRETTMGAVELMRRAAAALHQAPGHDGWIHPFVTVA